MTFRDEAGRVVTVVRAVFFTGFTRSVVGAVDFDLELHGGYRAGSHHGACAGGLPRGVGSIPHA